MPIYQIKKISSHLILGLWKISEAEDELTRTAIAQGISLHNKPITSNKTRITQWLSTRLLLKELIGNEPINYTGLGKPYLNNGPHISISHSNHFVAISLNKKNGCGIDIEKPTPKIERIKHKFLNPTDLQKVITFEDLTIYWGAKEALYKYYGKKNLLFIENLFINDFSQNDSLFKGKILTDNFQVELSMAYEKIEGFILVYTL